MGTISKTGFSQLQLSLKAKQTELNHVSKQIKESQERELSAIEENGELQIMLSQQDSILRWISKTQDFLNECNVIDISLLPEETDIVRFGSVVEILNVDTNVTSTFTILGDHESDPKKNIISYNSPLGKCLIGMSVGDETCFETESAEYCYEILSTKR